MPLLRGSRTQEGSAEELLNFLTEARTQALARTREIKRGSISNYSKFFPYKPFIIKQNRYNKKQMLDERRDMSDLILYKEVQHA